VSSKDVANFFQMKPRMASLLCARWVTEKFLVIENPSTKGRTYRLRDDLESLVTAQSAKAQKEAMGSPRA
jgi:hypothetical protein